MPLLSNRHGKARVRVARVVRDGDRRALRELSVETMLEGDFGRSFTEGDNAGVVATDTIKNLTNIVAREQLAACAEVFAGALAARLLERYAQISRASVTCHETRWAPMTIGGTPHPHSFVLDGNGRGYASVDATRARVSVSSGVAGFTLMKATQSGWVGFVRDECTTLPETTDRILATSMDATWRWASVPADYTASSARVLEAMLAAFATVYSHGMQDSMFRMGEAALAAVPELGTVSMACPNKHYIPVDLSPFGLSSDNAVFTPTDEPHGQIECTVGRE